MSKENVEMTRAFTDAFNARDVEALVACCDPSIEFHSTFSAVGGAVYNGHDELRRWYRDLEEAWGDSIRSELEALFDLADSTVLAFTMLHGRGKHSGAEVVLPIAAVTRFRDGLLVYYRAYIHREDALDDLGVSEEALEPIAP